MASNAVVRAIALSNQFLPVHLPYQLSRVRSRFGLLFLLAPAVSFTVMTYIRLDLEPSTLQRISESHPQSNFTASATTKKIDNGMLRWEAYVPLPTFF
jgi:hypothetical protein